MSDLGLSASHIRESCEWDPASARVQSSSSSNEIHRRECCNQSYHTILIILTANNYLNNCLQTNDYDSIYKANSNGYKRMSFN